MRTLSGQELKIMQIIWSEEESGRPGVPFATIHQPMGLSKQTVVTLITRIIDKGYMRAEGAVQKRSYFSTLTRVEYIALFAEEVMPGAGEIVKKIRSR